MDKEPEVRKTKCKHCQEVNVALSINDLEWLIELVCKSVKNEPSEKLKEQYAYIGKKLDKAITSQIWD